MEMPSREPRGAGNLLPSFVFHCFLTYKGTPKFSLGRRFLEKTVLRFWKCHSRGRPALSCRICFSRRVGIIWNIIVVLCTLLSSWNAPQRNPGATGNYGFPTVSVRDVEDLLCGKGRIFHGFSNRDSLSGASDGDGNGDEFGMGMELCMDSLGSWSISCFPPWILLPVTSLGSGLRSRKASPSRRNLSP